MNALSKADLTTLLVGLALLGAGGIWQLTKVNSAFLKVGCAILGYAGIVMISAAIPPKWGFSIALALSIYTIFVGIRVFTTSKLIGAVVITIGALAFIGGGYWDAHIPVMNMSLHDIWDTAVSGIKNLWQNANKGADKSGK